MIPDKTIIQRQPALSEQLYDYLRKLIRKGDYSPGGLFPSETELANAMDVSRPVVREALTRMKHDGLLESRKGGRTFVAMDISGLAFRINAKDQEEENFLVYLYELRAIIEPEAAAMAAMRATPQSITKIENKLLTLKKTIISGKDGADDSLEFHKAIFDASGNPHLARFIDWIGKKVWTFIHSNDMERNNRLFTDMHEEHEKILECIKNRDSKNARTISRDHVLKAAQRNNVEIILPKL